MDSCALYRLVRLDIDVQGTVLLGKEVQPVAVWRFEAVMVLLSGHWPPRGLLSGCWPPCSSSPIERHDRFACLQSHLAL